MKYVLLLLIMLTVNSCTSHEQVEAEKYIDETISMDWDKSIPFDQLYETARICHFNSEYDGCEIVNAQLKDISVSLNTCMANESSHLCRMVIISIKKHRISGRAQI